MKVQMNVRVPQELLAELRQVHAALPDPRPAWWAWIEHILRTGLEVRR
jgi:hypothetical protein